MAGATGCVGTSPRVNGEALSYRPSGQPDLSLAFRGTKAEEQGSAAHTGRNGTCPGTPAAKVNRTGVPEPLGTASSALQTVPRPRPRLRIR